MSHSGAAIFKKINGILTIDEETSPAKLFWRSTDGDKKHEVLLDTIDKLQATPATSEKLMLRLIGKVDPNKFAKDSSGAAVTPKPVTHMFTFNNRSVMDNVKITLQHIITRYKDTEVYEEKRRGELSGTPDIESSNAATPGGLTSAMSDAHGTEENDQVRPTSIDDSLSRDKLLKNLKLQQSLLKTDKALMKIFQETVINAGLPPKEFWSTRVALLRSFALSTSQRTGPYNVLSTIKPVASSENKVNVNLSREKILSIYENYPIVKKAYTDNVPKNFKEQEFWARFFSSKLFRKLRGEKIMQNDRGDVIIDRYLTLDQEFDRKDDERLLHPVSKFIDLEGNEKDDPVKKGNRPDLTMRPGVDANGNNDGTVDILKSMNRLSEKMVSALDNEYSKSNIQLQQDSLEDMEELAIQDLADSYQDNYATIHLKTSVEDDGNKINLDDDTYDMSNLSTKIKEPLREEIVDLIRNIIESLTKNIDLGLVSSDKEINYEINQKVISAVRINAKQAKHNSIDSTLSSFVGSKADDSEVSVDIPSDLLESCRMLHITCTEFLRHFYIHFQSGEQKRATTVKKLYKHLKDCLYKLNELFDDIRKGDGDELANNTSQYLMPVVDCINRTIEKYEACVAAADT